MSGRHGLIDDDGYFVQADAKRSRSRVVHQWDRYGEPFKRYWLDKQRFVQDSVPDSFLKGGKKRTMTTNAASNK